jgi:hypothetical protein
MTYRSDLDKRRVNSNTSLKKKICTYRNKTTFLGFATESTIFGTMIYAIKTGKKERELIFIQVQTFLGVQIMPTLRYMLHDIIEHYGFILSLSLKGIVHRRVRWIEVF